MRAQRAKTRRRCITVKLPWASPSLARRGCCNPFQPGQDEGGIETASGEPYDPFAWTAAIQTDLRETFGGIHHGKDYRPAYALVEVADKRAIIKINDVGPLKPGRIIDFNEQTMRYFDPSLQSDHADGTIYTVARRRLGTRTDQWVRGEMSGSLRSI